MNLSDLIRPDCEAAPWVIKEVRLLETELAEAKTECARLRAMGSWAHTCTHHTDEQRARAVRCPVCATTQSYVLLSEYTDYDQHGAYFIAWFHSKPTSTDIYNALALDGFYIPKNASMEYAKHILGGGGRRGSEDVWYILKQVHSSSAPATS